MDRGRQGALSRHAARLARHRLSGRPATFPAPVGRCRVLMSAPLISKEARFPLMCVSFITGEGGLLPHVRFLTVFGLLVNRVAVHFEQ